jgi:hypothetical protein
MPARLTALNHLTFEIDFPDCYSLPSQISDCDDSTFWLIIDLNFHWPCLELYSNKFIQFFSSISFIYSNLAIFFG